MNRETVEAARLDAGVDAGALCAALAVAVPVLRAMEPELERAARKAVPGVLRWALGGLAAGIMGRLLDALEGWADSFCGR